MASPKKKVTPENPRRRRGRPPGKRYAARVNASLPADVMAAIVRLAAAEDRSAGYVARALVMRGLEAAFQRRRDPYYGVLYPQEGIVELIVHQNPDAIARNINPFDHGSALHTELWKTEGLKQALDKYGFDAAFGGARRDEEKSRAKERIFSFRAANHH